MITVEFVELLVEEPSMEAALRQVLPAILGDLPFEIYPHQGKAELLDRLPQRLRGYELRRRSDAWFRDHCRIVVLVDRDDEDCVQLKQRLERLATDAGLVTRSAAQGGPFHIVNRLAIEELEAWYFGDWDAVRASYPGVSVTTPMQAKYRHPDAITGGAWEAFERILQRAGYFSGGLRKVEAARAIGANLDPSRNTSPSFLAFRDALVELAHI